MKSPLAHRSVAILLAIFCTILWGSAFPAVKSGYELFHIGVDDTAGKLAFAGLRFLVAGLFVLLFNFFFNKSENSLKSINKQEWSRLLLLGVIQTSLNYYFFYVGLSYTTGAKSSIINSSTVFFSAVMAHFLFANDRLTLKKGFGVFIGFIAVILVNLEGKMALSFTLFGEGFMVLAALFNSIGNLYSKQISRKVNPIILTAIQLSFGGLLLLVVGLAMGSPFPTSSGRGYLLLLYLTLISSVAFTIWTALLKYNKVSSITIFNFLIPVVGTLLSALILKEEIMQLQYLFALPAVAIGIYLVNKG